MPQIKLQKIFRPNWMLAITLTIVLLIEAYFAYVDIYQNLSTNAEYTGAQNIVRLDLDAYNNTLNQIDQNSNYAAPVPTLQNPNPFQ